MISTLSDSIQQIQSLEVPKRLQAFSESSVTEIFKYGAFVGHVIERHEAAERCMDLARKAIGNYEQTGESFPSGLIIIADELTGGKGRFLRHWHAPVGGVWLAFTIVNNLLPEHASFLPMAAGLSCCETACDYGVPAKLKWVNDVHVDGRKLAGILTETMVGEKSGEEYVIVGIGLNVNNSQFPDFLAGGAGSMRDYTSSDLDLNDVTARLIAKLSWNVGLLYFHEQKELDSSLLDGCSSNINPLVESFRNNSDTVGRHVNYGFNVISSPQYSGRVVEINDDGAIVIKLEDGSKIVEAGGEIVYL